MEIDASSSSDGIATEEQEDAFAMHFERRFNHEIRLEESEEPCLTSEDVVCFSVTTHWRNRAAQFETFKSTIQQWCKQDSPKIVDLQLPEQYVKECCAICQAVEGLEAQCQSLLTLKTDHTDAQTNLVEAKSQLAGSESQLDRSKSLLAAAGHEGMANAQMLQLMASLVSKNEDLVAKDEDLVADKAALVSKNAALVSKDADLVNEKASGVCKDVALIAECHAVVAVHLSSLRAAGNQTSLVVAVSKSEGERRSLDLDDRRFNSKLQSSPPEFDDLCNPTPLKLNAKDVRVSLTNKEIDLLAPSTTKRFKLSSRQSWIGTSTCVQTQK